MPNKTNFKPTGLDFIGLETHYPTVDGNKVRIHLDGAASPLACSIALDTIQKVLPHYSNTHSNIHVSAQICTQAMQWAHDEILSVLHAKPTDYTAVFIGSGTTAAINRVVRGLASSRTDKKIALISSMEHHANDLPHRQHIDTVEYIPLTGDGIKQGQVDLTALEALLIKHQGNVNYVSVSAISNVTGIINPITDITKLAHQYGALVIVDAAQLIAHKAVYASQPEASDEVDFWVFSGHKVYTPSAPGVLVAKQTVLRSLPQHDLGGGSVSHVSQYDYELLENFPDREQSGTPNIVGAIALANVMSHLDRLGYEQIEQHTQQLTQYLITKLKNIEKLTIYGDEKADRIGVVAFNHQNIDHGLLAAILSDYYGIAVRNECFCAHPYVSSLLKQALWEIDLSDIEEQQQEAYINQKRGMVRISLSLYNTADDIDYVIDCLTELVSRVAELSLEYEALPSGNYKHKSFSIDWQDYIKIN